MRARLFQETANRHIREDTHACASEIRRRSSKKRVAAESKTARRGRSGRPRAKGIL